MYDITGVNGESKQMLGTVFSRALGNSKWKHDNSTDWGTTSLSLQKPASFIEKVTDALYIKSQ